MQNYTGISKWVLINLGDQGLQSAMMSELELSQTDISNIAQSPKSYFNSLQALVHWRIGITNSCQYGCAPGLLSTKQQSTLGPLLTNMPDFAGPAEIPSIESVKYLMSTDDQIPIQPQIAYFRRNLAKIDPTYETVNLTQSQFSNLFSSNGKLLAPTNVLMLFENAKGNVGMADVIQRLDLGYMEQGNLVLKYLENLINKWSYWTQQGGDKALQSYSFLAREFMKSYLPNQLYQQAGDCAVYRITKLTFNQWIKVSQLTECDQLIDSKQLCGKFNLTDFFDARFYGPNSPQFAQTCSKMGITSPVLQGLIFGEQQKTYGGEFTTVEKYISDSYSCADQNKCNGKDLGPLQWFNSTYTKQRLPGILLNAKTPTFICDESNFFQLQAAANLLHYKFDQVKLNDDSLDLMYGNNKSGVIVSLLDDYFMKKFLLYYLTKEQDIKKMYHIGSPQFWYDYMAHAIEKHMLNGGADQRTITSQNVYDGIFDNPLINFMKNGTYQQGFDQVIAQVNYLPRMIPNEQLHQAKIQLRSGHRDVQKVRQYNRFINHAHIYKALFFYSPELNSDSRNQTLEFIPWANQAPIDGTDGTQFQPNLDGSQTLKFLDPIKYRSLELEKDDDSISRDGLNLIRYKIKDKQYESSQENVDLYYQRQMCYFNLTSIYNAPILSTQGIDQDGGCNRNTYFLIDKLSGYTVEYQIHDTFYINVEQNYALPSVNKEKKTEFYSLKRTYTRPASSIKEQFKDVDQLYSYKTKLMLGFFISGGLLFVAGIAILVTVCCLRKKAAKNSYVYYDSNLKDQTDDQ